MSRSRSYDALSAFQSEASSVELCGLTLQRRQQASEAARKQRSTGGSKGKGRGHTKDSRSEKNALRSAYPITNTTTVHVSQPLCTVPRPL